MTSFVDRLRAALSASYEVERELASGGMGTVFLARDIALDRQVAVKILRPDLATAVAAERFLQEARILARLSHPNVVPVHNAGEADGIFFYVMDYVEGETLKERLARGAMTVDEMVKLGSDLLEALEAAHEHEIVHRDVKPANVFLVGDRALLGDFGIAKHVRESSPGLTTPGQQLGTPDYMPPEQVAGTVSPRTDLYAVGMVLYEALTGRKWSILTPVDEAEWLDVPRRLAQVFRRALAWSPEDRWPDANTFRLALQEAAGYPVGRRRWPARRAVIALIGSLVALVVGVTVWEVLRDKTPDGGAGAELAVLAILPFEVFGIPDSSVGRDLARLAALNLQGLPELSLTPINQAFGCWDRSSSGPAGTAACGTDALGARYRTRGRVVARGDEYEVRVTVLDSLDRPLPRQAVAGGSSTDLQALGDDIALELVRIVAPDLATSYRGLPELGETDWLAVKAFLLGEDAYQRDNWRTAKEHYEAAIAQDSSFALAWWRLVNAWRWLLTGEPYPGVDYFLRLYADHAEHLPQVDRLLIEAQLAPAGEPRLKKYEEARARYPHDAYATFLYADEVFHRGPLVGRPMEYAAQILSEAADNDSSFAGAYDHLVWELIRLGRRDEAQRALGHLWEVAAAPGDADIYFPPLFEQGFLERFEPDNAEKARSAFLAHPELGSLESVSLTARFLPSFGLPAAQVFYGRVLAEKGAAQTFFRATGHEAQGLGLVALGRFAEALAHFDSAALLAGTPELAFQAAEWRVVPEALGMPGAGLSAVARGRAELERWVGDDAFGARAAWALAIKAYASGDTAGARRWPALLRASGDSGTVRLGVLAGAFQLAAQGRFDRALERSEPLLAHQFSAEPLQAGRSAPGTRLGGDVFARSALHLKRGEWFEELGETEKADREWLWYEAQDVVGVPSREAQAAEVDWALGTYARFRRGMAAYRNGDRTNACRHLTRVVELWSDADPAFAELAGEAQATAARACRES